VARAFEHLVQEEPPAPSRPARSGRGEARHAAEATAAALEQLATRVDQLSALVAGLAVAPTGRDATDAALEQLGMRVDRLAELVDVRTERAAADRSVAAVDELGRRVDRLTELVTALSERRGDGGTAKALSTEVKQALATMRVQLQSDVAKVTERVTSETSGLRTELHAALAATGDVGGDAEVRRDAIAATSEHIRALLAEERRAFRAHVDAALADQTERVHAALADERRALRAELGAVLSRLTEQAAEERKERRSELHTVMASSTERLRSVLVDERKELRGELQIVLPDVLRHRAEEWQQLRAALDASLTQSGESTLLAVSQFGQQVVDLRRELTATMAKANDRWVEERDQLFSELHAALATTAQQLADDQRRVRAALEAALADARDERLAFETDVLQRIDGTGYVAAELGEHLGQLRHDLATALGQLTSMHADQVAGVRADFRTGLVNSHNQLVAQQRELHQALETKLSNERQARYRDGIKQAAELRAVVDEVRKALADDRRDLRLLVAAAIEGANHWFTQLRDQLYERLETVIDVTAQSSASAASAVKGLRKDLDDGDPRLLEALARLGEEIERLEQRIPARIALRLPDSQLAAIAEAVRGGSASAPAGRGRSTVKKGAAAAKKAPTAKRAAARAVRAEDAPAARAPRPTPAAPARRPPATDPGVRSW
jgi:uncharacterized phage infection (PIP) family protein YhgE